MLQRQTTGGTRHAELDAWVREVAAHTRPEEVVWVTGSDEEIEAINAALVKIQDDGRLAARQEKWFGTATALLKEMPAM